MVKDILGLHEQSDGAELVGVEQRWYNGTLTFLKASLWRKATPHNLLNHADQALGAYWL